MLSFKHRSGVYFAAQPQPISAQQLNGGATCTLQIPAVPAIPEDNIKARERYMVALAVDYLCRWRVSTGATDSATPVTEDEAVHIAAFYGAIEKLDERNRRDLVVGSAPLPSTLTSASLACPQDTELIECKSKCCAEKRLHDWSADASEKQYFAIKGRPHVLVHFVHPCSGGSQLVYLNSTAGASSADSSASTETTATTAAAGSRAVSRDVRNALMSEMLSRVNDMRKRTDGISLNNRVEEQRTMRAEAADAQRRRESRLKVRLAEEDMQTCTKMIQRARAMTPEYSSEEENDEETSHDTYEESGEEVDGEAQADESEEDDASDESSDTFSDEQQDDEEEEEDDEEADAEDDVGEEEKVTAAEEPMNDALPTEQPSTDAADSTATNSTTSDLASPVEESQPQKRKACRQATVEMMVGVCESSDSTAFFDELELPYIVQWAAEDGEQKQRCKLHLFRKTTREVRGWVYSSKRNAYHWLGTIEALI